MPFPNLRSRPLRYLLLAGAIHVTVTIVIFLIGHFQLMPDTVDPHGVGLTFAIDGTSYRTLASLMVDGWQANGFVPWLQVKAPLHCHLYSLSFAIFGKLLGHNILAAEPLNLFYFLGTLSCVYLLGREIFNETTGLVAATIVAIWPTFLLHSTQLIRDPLSIFCLLSLMVVLTFLLSRELTWSKSIGLGATGVFVVIVFWLARGNMWNVVLVALATTLALLILRMIREKKLQAANIAMLVTIIAAALFAPSRIQSGTLPGSRSPATPFAIPSASQPAPPEGIWTRAVRQIATRRSAFNTYESHVSNIDADVQLRNTIDVLKFVPRATLIGFFAPFPNMWFEPGKFGRAGRLLSGLETLAMYFLYIAAGFAVWRERRNLKMWFLFLVAAIGMIGLGLVVANAGALFRIRYAFWMMLIVIAAEGLRHFTIFRTSATNS